MSNWQLKLTRTEERRNKKQTLPKGSVNWTLPVRVHRLPFSALTPDPGGGSTGHFSGPDSERHYKQKIVQLLLSDYAPSAQLPTPPDKALFCKSPVSRVHSHCSMNLNGLTAFVGFSNLFVTLKIAQLLMLPAWTRKSMQTHLCSRMRSPRWELVRGDLYYLLWSGKFDKHFQGSPSTTACVAQNS